MAVQDWSTTPASNTSVGSVSIAELCDPGNLNDAIRAVMADVRTRFNEIVSVKDYGAKGDGVTNDTAAFAAAFASGRSVHLPPGNYLITPSTFTGLTSLRIRGSGRDVSKITLTSTGTALKFANCQWLHMSDFTMEATGTAQTLASAIGIQLDTGSSNCLIENFIIRGLSLDGIRMVGTSLSPLSGNTIRNGYILGCGRNQLYGNYNNDFTIDNVQTGNLAGITHATFGMLLDTCGEGAIINTKTWENERGYKALNCTAIRHSAIRCELSDKENVWIEGGNDLTFDGSCRIHTSSQLGNGLYDNVYVKGHARLILLGDVETWDATYSKWGINLDTGTDDATLKCHQISGYDATNSGPIRVASDLLRMSSDITVQVNAASAAAAATVYLSGGGGVLAEGAAGRQCHTQLAPVAMIAACVTGPSAGKNFTYTLRKNGADTAVTCQISGTATTNRVNTVTPAVRFDYTDWFSIKLVTDSGATVTDHRVVLIMAEI
jgi:hypothetical protein